MSEVRLVMSDNSDVRSLVNPFRIYDSFITGDGAVIDLTQDDATMVTGILSAFFAESPPTFLIGNGLTQSALTLKHLRKAKEPTSPMNTAADFMVYHEKNIQSIGWLGVVQRLAREAGIAEDICKNNNVITLAELVVQRAPTEADKDKIERELFNAVADVSPVAVHHFIAFIVARKGGHIVTTNMDNVMDRALVQQMPDYKQRLKITVCDEPCRSSVESGADTSVYLHKLHGCLRTYDDKKYYQTGGTSPGTDDSARLPADIYYSPSPAVTVFTQKEYIRAVRRLFESQTCCQRQKNGCLSAMFRPLVVIGKAMYEEDITPNYASRIGKERRTTLFETFTKNASEEQRKFILKWMPKDFSGVFISATVPNNNELALLMAMGFFTLVATRSAHFPEVSFPVAFARSLMPLFPKQFEEFRSARGLPATALHELKVLLPRAISSPVFLAMGASGKATVLNLAAAELLGNVCIKELDHASAVAGPAITAMRTFRSLAVTALPGFAVDPTRYQFTKDERLQYAHESDIQAALVTVLTKDDPQGIRDVCRLEKIDLSMCFHEWTPTVFTHKRSDATTASLPQQLYNSHWKTTFFMDGNGAKGCVDSTVKYALSDAELVLWATQIKRQLARDFLKETRLIYVDRFLFLRADDDKPGLITLSKQAKMLLEVLKTQSREGHTKSPDVLVETGCSRDYKDLLVFKRFANIIIMGFTFYSTYKKEDKKKNDSISTKSKGISLIAESNNFFNDENKAIDILCDHINQAELDAASKAVYTDLTRTLKNIGQTLTSGPKNGRGWVVLTLRHRGAFWYDLSNDHCRLEKLVEKSEKSALFPAMAGDVFHGAFAASFCHQKDEHVDLKLCVTDALRIAADKVTFFSPNHFYQSRRGYKHGTKATVIGDGIIGLTTAIELIKRQFEVTVLYSHGASHQPEDKELHKRFDAVPASTTPMTFDTVSETSACWWMPFQIGECSEEEMALIATSAIISYRKWNKKCKSGELKKFINKSKCLRLKVDIEKLKKEWMTDKILAELRSERLIYQEVDGGIVFPTFIYQPQDVLAQLRLQVKQRGGLFKQTQELCRADILEMMNKDKSQYFVNCTGSSGQQLALTTANPPAPVVKIRGDLLHFTYKETPPAIIGVNTSTSTPVDAATLFNQRFVIIDESDRDRIAYAVINQPRIILGGTWVEGKEMSSPSLEEAPAHILRNCREKLAPRIAEESEVDEMARAFGLEWDFIAERYSKREPAETACSRFEARHTYGYRPYRKGGPVVCRDGDGKETNLFHNYGHGANGFTLSWGTAKIIARIMYDQAVMRAKL